MNPGPENPRKGEKTHTPILPRQEIRSNRQALALFIPAATRYLARHLTIGSVIRLRRGILRRLGRTYYV